MSYKLAPTYDPPNRVTCIPGYADKTSCKILVATLYNPTTDNVTLTVNGTPYVLGIADLPARGTNICFTGTVTITGLTAFTRYTWAVTQTVSGTTYTDSGSFMTAPNAGDSFTFFFAGCDSGLGAFGTGTLVGAWQYYKTYAQDSANPPVAGIMWIDDYGYIDTMTFDESVANGASFNQTTNAIAKGTVDGYLVSWCSALGMLGSTSAPVNNFSGWGRSTERAWCRKNMNLWMQWGDHELGNDIGWDTDVTSAGYPNAVTAFNAVLGLLKPPLDNVVSVRDTASKHWSFKLGDITLASFDSITSAVRVWNGSVVPGQGGTNSATSATLTQFTTVYGNNQIDDVLESINASAGKFTVMGWSNSLRYLVARTDTTHPMPFTNTVAEYNSGAQHPIYDHCLADYQRIFTRTGATPPSLMDNNLTNGRVGGLVNIIGDYHHHQVLQFKSPAYTGNARENFWAIHNASTGGANAPMASQYTSTGQTIADVLVDYKATSTDTAIPFFGVRCEYNGSLEQLTVRANNYNDTTTWTKKFHRSGGNMARALADTFPPSISVSHSKDNG